ncbi:MAG: hypothetical protein IT364_08085, partial [Candidatus Hydrogenedentes bacterium]|nr:hypothetical protein [Candidatus Hydrogenedentota bacterium]
MARKTLLGPELKRRFREQGYSMSRVAGELSLFENSLRSWVRRNRFPERELVQLAEFAGLPTDLSQLEEVFAFETTGTRRTHSRRVAGLLDSSTASLEEVADAIESRTQEVLRGKDASLEELRLLFRTLEAGSIYACSFLDQLPPEMTNAGWAALGREVAGAIKRGGHFLYLFPNTEHSGVVQAKGILGVLSANIIQPQSELFREYLASANPGLSLSFETGLILIPCGSTSFLSPGHQYLFFWQRENPSDLPRLFLRVPICAGTMVSSPLWPLSGDVANGFFSILLAELKQAGR